MDARIVESAMVGCVRNEPVAILVIPKLLDDKSGPYWNGGYRLMYKGVEDASANEFITVVAQEVVKNIQENDRGSSLSRRRIYN